MKRTKKVAYVFLAVLVVTLVLPSVIRLYPPLVGADRAYTVLSRSMSPALEPGDVVFVRRMVETQIAIGDIVTVESDGLDYTHRVVEKKLVDETYLFRLKGDANEDPDPSYVEASKIAGTVCLTLPISNLHNVYGYVLIVLVPLAVLAVNQVINIYKFIHRGKRRRRGFKAILLGRGGKRRNETSILSTTSMLIFMILVAGSIQIMAPYFASKSMSWFSDTETVYSEFTAGQWVIEAAIDIKPDTLLLNTPPITCYIELLETHDVEDIDVSTIKLKHGADFIAYAELKPTNIGDYDDDGISDLMVKFDRAVVVEYLLDNGYGDGDVVTFIVTGEFTYGFQFTGEDTIRVIS